MAEVSHTEGSRQMVMCKQCLLKQSVGKQQEPDDGDLMNGDRDLAGNDWSGFFVQVKDEQETGDRRLSGERPGKKSDFT